MTWRDAVRRIGGSWRASMGDIVFGVEDGAVSIFGLVVGVAAVSANSQAVLLAGATGAMAAAVSMMAGTYLDAQSVRDRWQTELADERARISADPLTERAKVDRRLLEVGFTTAEAQVVAGALQRNPVAMLEFATTSRLSAVRPSQDAPWTHALWMFVANLCAASIPVIPFAFYPLETARIISLAVTTLLLLGLGVWRGIVARRNPAVTAAQTVAVAAVAAAAGIAVGRLVTG
ncbi:MAG: VIT1/CCC1 transporter family protein [Candidatus Limnocylindrales bacterium]